MAVKTQGLMEFVGNLMFSPVKLVLTPMGSDRDSKGKSKQKGLGCRVYSPNTTPVGSPKHLSVTFSRTLDCFILGHVLGVKSLLAGYRNF